MSFLSKIPKIASLLDTTGIKIVAINVTITQTKYLIIQMRFFNLNPNSFFLMKAPIMYNIASHKKLYPSANSNMSDEKTFPNKTEKILNIEINAKISRVTFLEDNDSTI